MEIVTFNKKSENWIQKHAPTKIDEIIGSKKQVGQIIDWLKKFKTNKVVNLKKKESKKNGKKARKRKPKVDEVDRTDDIDETATCMDDKIDDEADELSDIAEDEKDGAPKEKAKKKDPNVCSCMIVSGDHGCGKSSLVKAILNDMGYTIRTVNFSKLGYIREINDFVENLLMGDNVYDIMQGISNRNIAVIVDEVESTTTPIEKNIVSGILSFNNETWACPVIFIGNRKHKKIINDIKKESYQIAIYEPEKNDMMNCMASIGISEDMKLEDQSIADKIIEYGQMDYRRMIGIMQELKSLYGKTIITQKILDQYMIYSDKKDVENTIYEAVVRLFTEYDGIGNALKIFEEDRINIPLMVQQNHFMAITRYIKNRDKLLELESDITQSIAMGDIIDNYVYSDQNWSLQETHGFYTCVYPSYKINLNIDKERLEQDSKYQKYKPPTFTAEYPRDLNKTSTKQINYKNIKIANKCFRNMTIDDYIFGIKVVRDLLEDDRKEECAKLLEGYDCSAGTMMYMLKIDKINGTKKDIPKPIENKIKYIFHENGKPVKMAKITKTTKTTKPTKTTKTTKTAETAKKVKNELKN